jgi:hypothetical protein
MDVRKQGQIQERVILRMIGGYNHLIRDGF